MPNDKDRASQFLFVSLAMDEEEAGKPFDGVAPGEFVDMWGREVEIESEDFNEYLENTLEAIKFTTTGEGEVVGLVIDAVGHFDDKAAGWIVDAQLIEVDKPDGTKLPVIQFFAKWTEQGRELIEKGIRRMFSPTLNTKKKTVLGGSLTNWPASRDEMGKVLLRPISLSEGDVKIELDRQAVKLEGTALFAASLVVAEEEGDYEETEVAKTEGIKPEHDNTNLQEGVSDMKDKLEFTQEELDAMIQTQVDAEVARLAEAIGEETDEEPEEKFSLIEALNLGHLEDEAIAKIEEGLSEEYKRLQKDAEESYLRRLAGVNHKREMTMLSSSLTSGNAENPRGLPIQSEQLVAGFLDLPRDQVPFWKDLLSTIVQDGLHEFAELGNTKPVKATISLPDEYAEALRDGRMELSDLRNPMLELGELSQYDLAEFQSK